MSIPAMIKITTHKPDWIANEGHWRLLQALRFLLSGVMALIIIGSLIAFFFDGDRDWFIGIILLFGLSSVSYWGAYAAAWTVCWVRDGFSQNN